MGSDLLWVEPEVLEVEICGIEAKEGDGVSAVHAFGGCVHGKKYDHMVVLGSVLCWRRWRKRRAAAETHRWELPGNYRDFRGVMVIYLFCRRTKRVLITPIIDFKIYILTQSLIFFI